jgi:hypothetical protein
MLVIPAVSFANVPQLAAEILLENAESKKIEQLDDSLVYPMCGCTVAGLVTPVEIFHVRDARLLFLRSPVLPGCTGKFVSDVILPIVKGEKVLVLASCDAALRVRPEDTACGREDLSGMAKVLVEVLEAEKCDIDVVGLFAYEGDNTTDAVDLARRAAEVLRWPDLSFAEPRTWELLRGPKRQNYEGGIAF